MKVQLEFRQVLFDTHLLRAGTVWNRGDSLKFMGVDDTETDADLVTKRGESELIRWLVASPAKDALLAEIGASADSFISCDVRQPVVENPQGKPGDIDLLICDSGRPDRAIALQCKRVKVTALNQDEDDDVSKLPDIGGGVKQANLQRANLCFYRNYLCVLIETDGRLRTRSNALFRGTTQETFQQIYQFPQRESLHQDVGVIFVEVSQPTGKSFTSKASVGICVDRDAERLEQSASLTNRIKQHMLRVDG